MSQREISCDESIRLEAFNNQNALYDLAFKFEDRGMGLQGDPLTPYIAVRFEQAFGAELSFKCSRVQATGRREIRIH